MNGPAREDILHFIERTSGLRLDASQQADVLAALDADGEQARQFMAAFAKEFAVDLTGFEPMFHHRDERRKLQPGWPFPAEHFFGVRLPLGVGTLTQAAQTGRWPLTYPMLVPNRSRHWLNVPLILIGLPILALLAIGVVRIF